MAVRGNYRTRASAGTASIEMTGPLFSPQADLTLRQNIRRMLQGLADEGARVVIANSPNGPGTRPDPAGSFKGGVEGRVRSLKGAPWWLTAVVSQQHVYAWGSRGGRSFGIAQSGVYKRGARKGQTWHKSDSEVLDRMSNASYRGGKVERKYHMFRNAANQMKSSRALLAADLTKGLE